ncbi:MAG: UDP-N-acetylmuramoyl-L-alanine--D-glutamate ligase [Candidatus Doudnabacteria bacterium]|nr:UDP-N-acetylmuramoyl-L-alanine--D-glutamate ligase [Candidatus Doudnabacteria bacterium]
MLDFLRAFQKKKLAVLGYGEEGRSTASFFFENGLSVTILDADESLKDKLGVRDNATFKGGTGYLSDLEKFDLVFRSPGFPRRHPRILAAEKKGVKITSQTKFFFEHCPSPIIGVTGTKGKGTCAELIFKILSDTGQETYLGGNIGRPSLDFLSRLSEDSKVVLELSSFQLEDLEQSPCVAVVLNIFPDHLNYHENFEEYVKAKANILKHQSAVDIAVLDADNSASKRLFFSTPAKKFWVSDKFKAEPGGYYAVGRLFVDVGGEENEIASVAELSLLGRHNWKNILAASVACRSLNVPLGLIRQNVKSYAGPAHHHLELVGAIDGVRFYDDSAATVPQAAIAAIKTFSEPKILILGGSDKGQEYRELASAVAANRVKCVILIGEVASKISLELSALGFSGKKITGLKDISKVVLAARACAERGDVVLLSPGAASFGMFANAKDRGEQFSREVGKLKNIDHVPDERKDKTV